MRIWSLDQEDPLEGKMALYSSILPWKISWIEKSDRLHSMGLQRVGRDRPHTVFYICVCVCMCVYFMFYSIIRYYYKILSAFHMLYLLVKFMKKYVIFTVLNAELIHKFSTFLQSQSFILHPFTLPCLPEQLSFKAQRGKHK